MMMLAGCCPSFIRNFPSMDLYSNDVQAQAFTFGKNSRLERFNSFNGLSRSVRNS